VISRNEAAGPILNRCSLHPTGMTQPTSTANYRKYPKGPNFLLVVILSGVAIIVIFLCAWLLLRSEGKKLVPKVPDKHPTSQLTPFTPPSNESASIVSSTLC
jgi:hypothetical protein